MGSSSMNLSRAVAAKLPGFTAGASNGGPGVHGANMQRRRRRRRSAGVPCCVHGRFGAGGSSRGLSSARAGAGLSVVADSPASELALRSSPESGDGIGVARFLAGKNLLITGGTGFLAKVLIEKILRTNPDVGKIYVLIKAKDNETAMKRLRDEVVHIELFKCLREIHGEHYHDFVLRKLVPVVGDMREAGIGIAPEVADEIAEHVDVIVNSAGNTTFDERYDVAMDINTLGPFRIMSFAHRFQRLKLFLHVSTAYVNGERKDVVSERPFRLGDSIAKELGSYPSNHNIVLDIEAEMKLAFQLRRDIDDSATLCKEMKDLGRERAKLHGWQDAYVFTKAMGEMVINIMRGDIPVVTIRPSIIESTWRDPFPGWIQGNRMMDPVILYYGKGILTGLLADPEVILDVVPADMVVSAMLAAMAKHGAAPAPAAAMHVYHVASSTVNPLSLGDMMRHVFQHFTRRPYYGAAGQPVGVKPVRLFDSMDHFASFVAANGGAAAAAAASGERPLAPRELRASKSVEQLIHLCTVYEPYTFYRGRFDSGNTERLVAEMSPEEAARFNVDVRSIDWADYLTNVHIPGLRKHIMKGRGDATSAGN